GPRVKPGDDGTEGAALVTAERRLGCRSAGSGRLVDGPANALRQCSLGGGRCCRGCSVVGVTVVIGHTRGLGGFAGRARCLRGLSVAGGCDVHFTYSMRPDGLDGTMRAQTDTSLTKALTGG